jgi:hypothetical protein
VRSLGLTRNRDGTGISCWIRCWKTGEVHVMRRRRSKDTSQGTWTLPQPRLLDRFIDAMRTSPCGDGGLAASLFQGSAACPSFCLFSSGSACSLCLASCQRQQKNAVIPYPHYPGQWPTAPSVDSVISCISISVRASSTAYFVLSRTLSLVH